MVFYWFSPRLYRLLGKTSYLGLRSLVVFAFIKTTFLQDYEAFKVL
jgi:hypothetical protein